MPHELLRVSSAAAKTAVFSTEANVSQTLCCGLFVCLLACVLPLFAFPMWGCDRKQDITGTDREDIHLKLLESRRDLREVRMASHDFSKRSWREHGGGELEHMNECRGVLFVSCLCLTAALFFVFCFFFSMAQWQQAAAWDAAHPPFIQSEEVAALLHKERRWFRRRRRLLTATQVWSSADVRTCWKGRLHSLFVLNLCVCVCVCAVSLPPPVSPVPCCAFLTHVCVCVCMCVCVCVRVCCSDLAVLFAHCVRFRGAVPSLVGCKLARY